MRPCSASAPRAGTTARRRLSPPAPDGFEEPLTGTDLITDRAVIRRHFGWLADDTLALLHARRCGWFSGQQLGMYLLERARDKGVRVLEGRVERVEPAGGRVTAVKVSGAGGAQTLSTPALRRGRRAAAEIGRTARRRRSSGVLRAPRQVGVQRRAGALPREAPLTIWTDPVRLPWSEDERAELADSEHLRLLDEFPPACTGARGRRREPVGLLIWTYDVEPVPPTFPVQFDPAYAEIAIRGMAAWCRRWPVTCRACRGRSWTAATTRRRAQNRFLAGPLPLEGAFVIGALSGYGLMSSNTAADLLAAHITGAPLPPDARAFMLSRYDDPTYAPPSPPGPTPANSKPVARPQAKRADLMGSSRMQSPRADSLDSARPESAFFLYSRR